jgi:hypothetical protein
MTRYALALECGEEVGLFLEVMKSIRISANEVDQPIENVRRHMLSPGESGADPIKRSQAPLDYPVFVL